MGDALASALCLVLVIEGLFLFAAPDLWKRMAEQLQPIEPRRLRLFGGGLIVIGLILLRIVH
ncbi:MAG TPA: DUF2065 family protein [Dokdonella sp.]|nr:DUF2065 family protein [Dokdonella sp.]